MGIFLIAFLKFHRQLQFHYLFSTSESPVAFIKADKDFQKQSLKRVDTLADADFSDKVPFELFGQVSVFGSSKTL